eukprot:scaffold113276_cov69-Phaeocystis_antarctica.AAC.8
MKSGRAGLGLERRGGCRAAYACDGQRRFAQRETTEADGKTRTPISDPREEAARVVQQATWLGLGLGIELGLGLGLGSGLGPRVRVSVQQAAFGRVAHSHMHGHVGHGAATEELHARRVHLQPRLCEAVWRGYVVRLRGCRSAYMLAEGGGRAEQEAVEGVEASLHRVGVG